MLTAFGVSIAFLTCYLIYHFNVGSVRFQGPPDVRTVYLIILVSHILLAVTVPVLAGVTIYLGYRDRGRGTSAGPNGPFPSGFTSRSRAS